MVLPAIRKDGSYVMGGEKVALGISRGQRAWSRIKSTAEEQRTLWLEVGVALMYGKQKENRPAGQKFSDWADATFPGISKKHDVPAALWYAAEFPSLREKDLPFGLSSPQHIQAWFKKHGPSVVP